MSEQAGNGATAMMGGTPPAAPATPPASATPPAEGTWYSGFDQETVGWMENRGLTKLDEKAALAEAIKGHRNAEKYMGVPQEKLLRLPDFEKADAAELDSFFGKLGRPSKPEDYKLNVPEGQSRDFASWAEKVFHETGLMPRQAAKVTEAWNTYMAEAAGKAKEAQEAAFAQAQKNLQTEWGEAYERNDFYAGEAMRRLGITADDGQKLAQALGFDKAMKLFADIGSKTGEDRFVAGSGPANGPMTPAQAKSRIDSLTGDKEFRAKLMAGNAEARAEWDRLHLAWAAGNG